MEINKIKELIIESYNRNKGLPNGSSKVNGGNAKILYEPVFSNISQILTNSSFLFYEFEDKEVEYNYDEGYPELGKYTRDISPLFLKNVVESESNNELLNIIDEEVPLYHIQPEHSAQLDAEDLSDTRDCGVNNVHSALQDSSFYQVWLRDVFGSIQNQLLLNSYNKMRWPVIGENQYIMADLFPSLAMNAFRQNETEDTSTLIEFRETAAENLEDNNFYETIDGVESSLHTKVGCVDYLNEIVEKKLSSVYDILDYHPGRRDVITAWGESLHESAQVTSEDLEKQLIIYKLQDVKYELLKRKYAGTKTLYNLTLNALDRQGSFISAVPLSSTSRTDASDLYFVDKRLIRILNIPGVTVDSEDTSYYPLNYLTGRENSPSINDIASLYYSSGAGYNAENFYTEKYSQLGDTSVLTVGTVGDLRKNVKYLNWNCLLGMSKGQTASSVYNKLDTYIIDTEYTGEQFSKLDSKNPVDDEGKSLVKDSKTGAAEWSFLDYAEAAVNISNNTSIKDIIDLSANRILYNSNILQQEEGESYPYVTYKIASGNSISLMDTSWMEYIQTSIEEKSRVQEDIEYGAQLNKYQELSSKRLGRYSFFAISYDTDGEVKEAEIVWQNLQSYSEEVSFAYLWYCTVEYEVDTFTVQNFDKKIISRIVLKVDAEDDSYSDVEEYQELKTFSKGILPFTYFGVSDDTLLGKIYDGRTQDLLTEAGYGKAYYVFSDEDLLQITIPEGNISLTEFTSLLNLYEEHISSSPSANTKTIFYVAKKGENEYAWSSPIRVFNLESLKFETGDTFYPDWYDECYFLNPYLNFTKNSASPLRNKRVYSTQQAYENYGLDEIVKTVSDNIYLSNLVRFRGKDFLCCDKGEEVSKWIDLLVDSNPILKNYSGFYLDRIETVETIEEASEEKCALTVYGDPRTLNIYDEALSDELTTRVTLRGETYSDASTGIKCLSFESKLDSSIDSSEGYQFEYLKLIPGGASSDSVEAYKKWWWNTEKDGMFVAMNIALNPKNPRDGIYNNPVLLRREGEFCLSLEYVKDSEAKVVFKYGEEELESNSFVISDNNIRLSAGTTPGKKLLIVVDGNIKLGDKEVSPINTLSSEEPIYLGINVDANSYSNCFLGELYDLRLYNRGFAEKNAILLAGGSFRELYSYSPDLYILAYNNYIDLGIFKEISSRIGVGGDTALIDEITALRTFNRSVWDSIMIDRCPITADELNTNKPFYRRDVSDSLEDTDVYGWVNGDKTLKDCVEIDLESFESLNNASLRNSTGEKMNVKYNGRSIEVDESDHTTAITTMVYPVVYSKDSMIDSNSILFKRESDGTMKTVKVEGSSESAGLLLPQAFTSTDGNVKYEADFSLNFTINSDSDFTNYYSKGSNISLQYNNLLQKPVIVRNNNSDSSSAANHVLIPLTVPRQQELSIENVGYFDRLNLSNVELNNSLNTLLKATSYYNELRIPVAMDVTTDSKDTRGSVYASKWDAIRTLKEGTYYITCKYPFQILPFADNLYDTTNKAKYNYLYATVRFKVEVSGTPIVYENGKNGAEDITASYKEKYNRENIISTLKSTSALFDPLDNRTFPHRKINIDLYVQDCSSTSVAGRMQANSDGSASENYSFYWKLLGTNHPDDYKASKDWILLTKQTLENSLVITTEIPAFFSKNMTSPFFIAKSEKTASNMRVNSASADDDLIDPIRINPIYNSVKLTSYVKASGVATAGTSYYVKSGSSYYLADPQPEVLTDVSANYYTKIESLDNLQVQSENDLDSLILVAGRAYKILWDYTGYVSEFSFTDKLYSQTAEAITSLSGDMPKYEMVDSEKTNYARLSSLLDLENVSDYSYNENGTGYNIYDTQLSGKTNGYQVSSGEYVECYKYEKEEREALDSNFIKSWLTSPGSIVIGNNSYVCNANAMLSSCTLKIASSENDVPTNIPVGVIYKVEGTENCYTAEGLISVKAVSSLTESVWDTLEIGGYYRNSESESIYRMGVQLENVVFKDGDVYKVWNYYDFATVSVDDSTYKGSSYCPVEADIGKIYPSTENGIYYRYVDSDTPHFTEVSAVANSSKYSNEPFYFGNPYSRSSESNYLLKIRDASSSYSRANITNSWYFPYTPSEVPENQFLSAGLLTSSTPLEVKVSDYGDISQIALDEKDILSKQHDSIWTSIKTAIASLINGNDSGSQNTASGIFTALSSVRPNYYYGASAIAQDATYVRTFSDDLISYLASDRTYPSKNENILITRRGLYSNNLIKNQDLDNASYWTWGNASNLLGEGGSSNYNLYSKEYVSDSDWDEGLGKDVCEVTYRSFGDGEEDNSSNPLTVKYASGSTSVGAVYEVALNIKVSSKTYDGGTWSSTTPRFYAWVETSSEETSSTLTLTDVTNNVEYRDYYPETATNLIVVKKSSLEARGYLGTDVSGESLTLNQWENKGSLILGNTQTVSSSEKNALLKELYVDSQANDVTVYATFLSNGTKVGNPLRLYVTSLSQQNEDVSGLAAFDDQWYTISAEPSSIVTADSIAFEFICKKPVKFRLTKVVVRKSDSKTHALGLADGLYTKKTSSNNASVIVSSHHCIAYRNKTTKEMIPVQFNATVSKRASSSSYTSASINYALSGLANIEDFRTTYSLGYEASNKKVEKLMDPWKRRFYYNRSISSDIQEVYFKAKTGEIYEEYYNTNTGEGYQFERRVTPVEDAYYYFLNGSNEEKFIKNNVSGGDEYIGTAAENGNYYVYRDGEFRSGSVPFIEKTYFHKYEVKKGTAGVKEESENKLSVKDLYLPIEDSVAMYDTESDSRSVISIRNLKLNTSVNSVLNKYSTNLVVTSDSSSTSRNKVIKAGPITVSNIKVSALANCFDYEKYRSNEENILAITNIQLLGEQDSNGHNRVLFEIEYPPVVLKEGKQHLSCNILLHKKASATATTEKTS